MNIIIIVVVMQNKNCKQKMKKKTKRNIYNEITKYKESKSESQGWSNEYTK